MIPKRLKYVIFYLKETNSKQILNPGISCYSSSKNHYVLCCKRLNGLGQSVLNVKGLLFTKICCISWSLKTGKEEKEKRGPFDGKGIL